MIRDTTNETWHPTESDRWLTRFGTVITDLHWKVTFHDYHRRQNPEKVAEILPALHPGQLSLF